MRYYAIRNIRTGQFVCTGGSTGPRLYSSRPRAGVSMENWLLRNDTWADQDNYEVVPVEIIVSPQLELLKD
ncbi:MAG: hypothetical protein MN733_03325 [Nitrososphaera sp.]|nr:hypothetical protein [Nitrososphaera sp.]